MARSSLLAALARLGREHAAAKRRGVEVAQVRDERARALSVSRRDLLKTAWIGAAALALPKAAFAGTPSPRIAIIGAGISGLSAALALADAGHTSNVTVYEASNRIGGRMYSNSKAINGSSYWDDDQVTEWCGELVDSGHTTVQALCARYNLNLVDLPATAPANSGPVYYLGGAYYTLDQVDADFAPVYSALEADAIAAIPDKKADGSPNTDGTVLWNAITVAGKALDAMSIRDWIDAKVPGGHASKMGKLLELAYASEFGADVADQSALNLVLLLAGLSGPSPFAPFGASDEKFHIDGGNQQLPLAIANDLQTKYGAAMIQMNSRLTRIARNSNGTLALTFAVTAAGQTTTSVVTADAAILTLPFAVLADSVDYSGLGFDSRKQQAITQLGRGLCSKLQLQFTSRVWNTQGAWGIDSGEETFSDNGDQCSWHVTRGQSGVSGILNSYTGGTPTQERATTAPVAFGKVGAGSAGAGIATLATTFLGQLEQIFPTITPLYNAKATLSLPHLADNFKLAYSFWKKGQYTAFAGYERTPQGNVFFGGEHTSVNFQGFMEGGAAEGQRAAAELIAAAAAGTLVVPKGSGCSSAPEVNTGSAFAPVAALAAGALLLRNRGRGDR